MSTVRALPAYPGSKIRQVRDLARFLPKLTGFAEPFAGSACFTLHLLGQRLLKPSTCWINDLNPHLMNYFEVLQTKTDLLVSELLALEAHNGFGNHELFCRAVEVLSYPRADSLERAIAFYVFQNGSYYGKQKFNYSSYAPSTTTSPRGLTKSSILNRGIAGRRLKGVRLSGQSYEEVVAKAAPSTLLFMDPPYTNTDMYSENFSLNRFASICHKYRHDRLMMITLDDSRMNRERFADAAFTTLARRVYYQTRHEKADELMIINYDVQNLAYWASLAQYKIINT